MLTEKNVHLSLPPDLAERMESAAQAAGMTTDEAYRDAAQRFLTRDLLASLNRYGQGQAEKLGLREDDVDRLIHDHRQGR